MRSDQSDIVLDNLEDISRLTAAKEGWTEDQRARVLSSYMLYLQKCARGEGGRPTLAVDRLWHEHILHTQIYERDMKAWFGRFIHHRACVADEYRDLFTREPSVCGVEQAQQYASCGAPQPAEPEKLHEGLKPRETDIFIQKAGCGAGTPTASDNFTYSSTCGAPRD